MKRIGTSVLVVVGMTASAAAHIHLTNPLSRTDNVQGDPQKNGHCGDPTWDRAAHLDRVKTYAPGSTITVTWAETINHPGHFRIAFQPEGAVFRVPPPGTAVGLYPDIDETGKTDNGTDLGPTTTGTMILADMIPDGTLSKDITFPNIECENCTLQFIQVMTNNPPYSTVLTGGNDLYFNCADIKLVAGTTNPDPVDPGAGSGSGGTEPEVDPDTDGSATIEGGCSTTSHASGLGIGLALLVGLRRRRR